MTNADRVYRVEQVSGSWVWLHDENGPTAGWVTADWVIPYDQAIDYFTNAIWANPNDAVAYHRRGNLWGYKREFDKALADYDEVIRLEPASATGWWHRRRLGYQRGVRQGDRRLPRGHPARPAVRSRLRRPWHDVAPHTPVR